METRNSKIRAILFSLFPEELVIGVTGWSMDTPLDELGYVSPPNTIEYDDLLVFALCRWLSLVPDAELYKTHEARADSELHPKILDILPQGDALHWARMSTWTISESSLLSLGVIPSENVINAFDEVTRHGWGFPITREYARRKLLLMNAIVAGDINAVISDVYEELSRPFTRSVIEWSERVKIEYDSHLAEHVYKIHQAKEKSVSHPSGVNTMLKIILAIAIEKYEFNPSAKRNQAISKIETDTELNGLRVQRDTILKHLRSAVEKFK